MQTHRRVMTWGQRSFLAMQSALAVAAGGLGIMLSILTVVDTIVGTRIENKIELMHQAKMDQAMVHIRQLLKEIKELVLHGNQTQWKVSFCRSWTFLSLPRHFEFKIQSKFASDFKQCAHITSEFTRIDSMYVTSVLPFCLHWSIQVDQGGIQLFYIHIRFIIITCLFSLQNTLTCRLYLFGQLLG